MLDRLLPDSLAGISICDPACGDGAFLVPAAERICRQALASGDLRPFLESLRMLSGFDIDEGALRICRARLDAVLAEFMPGTGIDWNLRRIDAIDKRQWRQWRGLFDCIAMNPPYVRVQHLEEPRRRAIREGGWKALSGCTDLYMLFFEYAMELLREGGSLCCIAPSSWMRSNAGRALRDYLGEFSLDSVLDFAGRQVFEGATTYPAVARISKRRPAGETLAESLDGKDMRLMRMQGKWLCVSSGFASKLSGGELALGDVADIHAGIQTLADKVFILPVARREGGRVFCVGAGGEVELEAGAVQRIVKPSAMRNGEDKVDRVIVYPYRNGMPMSEAEFAGQFPLAHGYLESHRERLMQRDKGAADPRKWFLFGRSTGLAKAEGTKILTPSMCKMPNFQLCEDPSALFYSGYSVKPRPGIGFGELLAELNSAAMQEYLEQVSGVFRDGWRSCAKSVIKDFPVSCAPPA